MHRFRKPLADTTFLLSMAVKVSHEQFNRQTHRRQEMNSQCFTGVVGMRFSTDHHDSLGVKLPIASTEGPRLKSLTTRTSRILVATPGALAVVGGQGGDGGEGGGRRGLGWDEVGVGEVVTGLFDKLSVCCD